MKRANQNSVRMSEAEGANHLKLYVVLFVKY